jgi:hypothetical protein
VQVVNLGNLRSAIIGELCTKSKQDHIVRFVFVVEARHVEKGKTLSLNVA